MSKVVILIDGGYYDAINGWIKGKTGRKLDVEKLSRRICGGNELIRTKFYHANPYQSQQPSPEEQNAFQGSQRFQYAINRIPKHEFVSVGRVRQEAFNCTQCGKRYFIPKQKGVDVAISLDLVKMARKRVADMFAFVTGDEDFSSAVEMAQEELCNVMVYYIHDPAGGIHCSIELRNAASDRFQMDQMFLSGCLKD